MDYKNYRREFLTSPHHAYMGLSTIGLGLLSGHVFGVIIGIFAYSIGWLYLPDTEFFKKFIDEKENAVKKLEEAAKVEAFRLKQTKVLNGLNGSHTLMYHKLKLVCLDIEKIFVDSGSDAQSIRMGSLDKLMWAYLRLLGMQEMLAGFMADESTASLDAQIVESTKELTTLTSELKNEKSQANTTPSLVENKDRVIKSKQERLDAIKQRRDRIEQAKSNLAYVIAEQERLYEQILLMRSDVMASRDAQSLTLKIDATVDHIEQANQIMKQFEGISEITDDVPLFSETRMGYGEAKSIPENKRDNSLRSKWLKEKQ